MGLMTDELMNGDRLGDDSSQRRKMQKEQQPNAFSSRANPHHPKNQNCSASV
jgi:hypothetical protein